ncbi:YbdD/YjiX family protein [Arthrobacter sp. RAF14]|uniref:YbdD/YjiX family protein n=1 Tax=Arthrobacter sp. RAF14 TaxID=3233051 RepID=UPI003F91CF30
MSRDRPTTAAAPSSSADAPSARPESPWERLALGVRSVRRGLRGVLGADAYEKYLEFHTAHHPDHEPLSEAEFWRDRTDRQDRNPQGRCC